MSLHVGQAELRRQLSQLSARIPSSSGIHLDDGASGAEDTVAKPNQRIRRRSETQSSDRITVNKEELKDLKSMSISVLYFWTCSAIF